ncbi:MAG: hypothetical protein RSE41_08290 [Clostridia bacterium]
MKKEKGITLISVVITIIILLIITGVVLATMSDNGILDKTYEAKFSTEISGFYEEYNKYVLEQYMRPGSDFDESKLNVEKTAKPEENIIAMSEVIPSMKNSYYLDRITIVKGKWIYTNFTQKEKEIADNIINRTYQIGETPATPEGGDSKYIQKDVNKPMPPVAEDAWNEVNLKTKILPVMFDENGNYEVISDFSKEWYKYEPQIGDTTTGGTSKWANIMTEDGSFWVWIPRYAYKITSGAHSKVLWTESNRLAEGEGGTIEVKFLKENTNEFWDGTVGEKITTNPNEITYNDTGTKIVQNEWFVPPAFNFGGKELTGFWVAKYEASSVEGNSNNIAKDNVLREKTIQIKPGKSSWRYIETKRMFGNSAFMGIERESIYGFAQHTQTHLMKNIEWGATAYLAHSQYGRNGTAISPNTSPEFITGAGGKLSSTTGNFYGIFDMVGGASDAVAGVFAQDKELVLYEDKINVAKYFDIYEEYNPSKKGDAMYETSIKNSTTTSWFKGLSWMPSNSEPRISRGGMYKKHSSAGGEEPSIFGFYRYKVVEQNKPYKPENIISYQIQQVSFRQTIII